MQIVMLMLQKMVFYAIFTLVFTFWEAKNLHIS
uniref:Uncharacterized protein n=1 Tax=Podoviridae sp. ctJDl18 TaxID=2825242 RepID=A0A8S5V0L3_9CAUD|nr:MAG TPA: hypothetical protein [Podoviridae sp. ctJDl18]